MIKHDYSLPKIDVKGIVSLWLDDKDFFSILIPVRYSHIGFGLYGEVSFNSYLPSHRYRIYELFKGPDDLWDAVSTLEWKIEELLAGALELERSRFGRLGYELNEYEFLTWHDRAQGYNSWDGWKYMLWGAPRFFPSTWIYSCEGKFYFEIAPRHHRKTYKIPYKVFMRNYRPLVQIQLTTEQLHNLVQQAQRVSALMFENQKKFESGELIPEDYE